VAWCVSFWVLTLPAIWYAGKPIEFGVAPVISATWRYTVAALTAAIAGFLVLSHTAWLQHAAGTAGAAMRIACTTALFTVFYLGSVVILYGGPAPLRTMQTLLGELRGRRPAAQASDTTSEGEAVASVE
jgi:hypothetical protein